MTVINNFLYFSEGFFQPLLWFNQEFQGIYSLALLKAIKETNEDRDVYYLFICSFSGYFQPLFQFDRRISWNLFLGSVEDH